MAASEGSAHLTTEELFRQHSDFVARFLTRLGVPSAQLEDALQEVFLVVHRNGGYRPGLAKPTSYLASIAIRAASEHRRRSGVARTRHSDAVVDAMPGGLEDPARALQRRQDLNRLQLALERLPEELRTTLLLVEMEGESCVSVAAGLGCPVGTIYWRLHQARKELRAALRLVDAARLRPGALYDERDEIPEGSQPARTWMMLFGLEAFGRSEEARLLQLAREQPTAAPSVEQLIARHRELIRAGAQLPSWASGLAPHSASLLGVIGAGPIALGLTASGAILAAVMFAPSPAVVQPSMASAPTPPSAQLVTAPVSAPVAPVVVVAAPPEKANVSAPSVERPSKTQDRTEPATATRIEPAIEAAPHAREAHADVARVHAAATQPATERPVAPRAAAREPAALDEEETARAQPQPEPEPEAKPAPPDPKREAAERMDRAVTDAELTEMREIARAERLITEDPARALALTRALEAGYPEGRFGEERAYIEVMALNELGRSAEMKQKANAFLRAHPAGLYSGRVRKVLAGEGR